METGKVYPVEFEDYSNGAKINPKNHTCPVGLSDRTGACPARPVGPADRTGVARRMVLGLNFYPVKSLPSGT